MEGKFVGNKKIKKYTISDQKTPGGFDIIEVEFENGDIENFSSLLFEHIVTTESVDASTLRNKRVEPMVGVILAMLRDWGIKIGELPYMSVLLNQSLDFNQQEAMKELWSEYMPRPLSLDDVDLLAVDKVLKNKKTTLKDVIGNEK